MYLTDAPRQRSISHSHGDKALNLIYNIVSIFAVILRKANFERVMTTKKAASFIVAALSAAIISGCGGGGGGSTPPPSSNCTTHNYKACSANSVYWYDSCNAREDVFQACSASETCSNAQCVTNEVTWNKTFGGAAGDTAEEVRLASDGGYVVAGETKSSGAGASDFYLLKLDASGEIEWNKVYGGASYDVAMSAAPTSDSGYAFAGRTESYGAGLSDFWLVKYSSSGTKLWDKTFGGSGVDIAEAVRATSDGGYIIAGYTYSYGAGNSDMWLVKTDSSGVEQWNAEAGGTGIEVARDVRETSDGGFIAAGFTEVAGTGLSDFMLVKFSSSGAIQWQKTFGGSMRDQAYSVIQTSDGGFAMAGLTESYGSGQADLWVVKTNSSGSQSWTALSGGAYYDGATSIAQTSDGGYIVTGYIESASNKEDMALLKLSSTGAKQWQQTFGGADRDYGNSVAQTTDGGYIIAGHTRSTGAGEEDAWVVKTNSSGVVH